MRINHKILLAITVASAITIAVTGTFVSTQTTALAQQALQTRAFSQLVTIREIKRDQIERYFAQIRNQLLTMANSLTVQAAMQDFASAYPRFSEQSQVRANNLLSQYYQQQFSERFKQLTAGDSANAQQRLTQLDSNSQLLQQSYIAENPHPLGSKNSLDFHDDPSDYSQMHQLYHPQFNQFLNAFGYYDIFLVEPNNGHVVYSVYKELDYATSLNTGPYRDSGLAQAYRLALQHNQQNEAWLVDFAPYYPSYNAAAAFIATAIHDQQQRLIGVLIFQLPVDVIEQIMTFEGNWQQAGLGESGQTYIVGADSKLRSQNRFLLEQPDNYFKALQQSGVDERSINTIRSLNSAIGLQSVHSESVTQALSGHSGFQVVNDFRQQQLLSAFTPLNITGVNWALISEIDQTETLADVAEMRQQAMFKLLLVMLIVLPLAAIAAWFISRGISKPIQYFVQQIHELSQNKNLTLRINYQARDELKQLAGSLNHLIQELQSVLQGASDLSQTLRQSTDSMLNRMQDTKQQTESQSHNADSVAVATNQLLATTQEVARSASGAAQAVVTTNTKCDESSQIANSLALTIDNIQQQMFDANRSIQQLAQESQSIATVLDVIQGIAEQTNLLALNAAIEAARAGEQGRGFAVVADEVRTLASRTQQSTEDIRQKISSLQKETAETVNLVTNSNQQLTQGIDACKRNSSALVEVVALVSELNSMNLQIATAAEQQTAVIGEINQNINQVAGTATTISQQAEDNQKESERLMQLVSQLDQRIRSFTL